MNSILLVLTLAVHAAPKLPADALPLPLMAQTTDYDCGPTALASVLKYWNVFDGKGTDLFDALETTPKDGTEPVHLAIGAARFGLKANLAANMTLDDLRAALERGDTVILDLQAWSDDKDKGIPWKDRWEDGHYVVLAGMDKSNAFFMDPSTHDRYAWVPLSELGDRWHDYESRHGYRQEYRRLGVVISGGRAFWKPVSAPPPSRMD